MRYVAVTGDDQAGANSCLLLAFPCGTISNAVHHASSGNVIDVGAGQYTASSGTEVVLIDKSLILLGGWSIDFVQQAGSSIVDGQMARRGVTINPGNIVVIDHFTIRNGHTDAGGGGIDNEGSVLTLTASVIAGNSTFVGGGIYNLGSLTINSSIISNNTAGMPGAGAVGGGGIENEGIDSTLPRRH